MYTMQNSQHPSLPPNPSVFPQQPVSYPTYYNSHYLQAYTQAQPQLPPAQYYNTPTDSSANANQAWLGNARPAQNFCQPSSSSWYQPGNQHCNYKGCFFTGSHRSLEVHMMDRHLIFPPGWEKQKKRKEWDADPSLKGKPIPIQGTNVILDSPEVLEAWIAERKRRFPTSSRVEDKQRKMEEAVARGQLDPVNLGLCANKRRKTEIQSTSERSKGKNYRHEQRNGASGKYTEPARVPDAGWGARMKTKEPQAIAIAKATRPVVLGPSTHPESDSDDDAPPEIISSKTAPDTQETKRVIEQDAKILPAEKPTDSGKQRKPRVMQPKMPPRNPFASRPTLLRNLLLPEIRMTVSNLSQAIRFLVDNNFLRDVEFKPGQAAERNKIEVVQQNQDTKSS